MTYARRAAAALASTTVLVIAACSTAPSVPEGPWAEEIRTAQSSAKSDFQKKVLSDGVITQEEYIEALDRWVACMEDAGLTAGVVPEGDGTFSYSIASADGDIDRQNDTCREATVDGIDSIYIGMLQDPANRTGPELMRDCLVAAGKLDGSFTAIDMEEQLGPIIEGTSRIVDNMDPAVVDCVRNPFSAPPPS